MRFISESGYSIKVGQEEAHQHWLEANEEALAASVPEGVATSAPSSRSSRAKSRVGSTRPTSSSTATGLRTALPRPRRTRTRNLDACCASRPPSATGTSRRRGATGSTRLPSTPRSSIRPPDRAGLSSRDRIGSLGFERRQMGARAWRMDRRDRPPQLRPPGTRYCERPVLSGRTAGRRRTPL